MRRSRKPLDVLRRLEGSNPSLSAICRLFLSAQASRAAHQPGCNRRFGAGLGPFHRRLLGPSHGGQPRRDPSPVYECPRRLPAPGQRHGESSGQPGVESSRDDETRVALRWLVHPGPLEPHVRAIADAPTTPWRPSRRRVGGRSSAMGRLLEVLVRLRRDSRTRAHSERGTRERLSKMNVIGCPKRYLAREVYRALCAGLRERRGLHGRKTIPGHPTAGLIFAPVRYRERLRRHVRRAAALKAEAAPARSSPGPRPCSAGSR